jgi:hypothetical protein
VTGGGADAEVQGKPGLFGEERAEEEGERASGKQEDPQNKILNAEL